MITAKRMPKQSYNSSNIKNYSKHFNQMSFKGIIHNENIYDVDQTSFREAKNIYVNDDLTLVSRLPIVPENLPNGYIVIGSETIVTPIVPSGFYLVDLFETGKIVVYISQNSNSEYYIVAMEKDGRELKVLDELVNKYHISAIEKYIIVFNNIDAVILDINDYSSGWQLLRNLAEVPITKRIVGQEVFENPSNQFTESYKEQYVWSKEVLPVLPEGTAEVSITQSPANLTWVLENANINTEFRLLRRLGIEIRLSDLISVATNENTGVMVLAIGRPDHVLLSYDNGQTFDRILYPNNKGFLQIASISKDGLHYFFVAEDGVFRYDISDAQWSIIRIGNNPAESAASLQGVGVYNTCCFNNAEVFSFVLYSENSGLPTADIYFKGPGLAMDPYADNTLGYVSIVEIINPTNQLTLTRQDSAPFNISVEVENDKTRVTAWLPSGQSSSTVVNILEVGSTLTTRVNSLDNAVGLILANNNLTVHPITTYEFIGAKLKAVLDYNNQWNLADVIVGWQNNTSLDPETSTPIGWEPITTITYLEVIDEEFDLNGAPLSLVTGYINNLTTLSVDGVADLPKILNGEDWPNDIRLNTVVNGNYFYTTIGNRLYTNNIISSNNATITYTRLSNEPFTQIPNLSHVNNELYLTFDNILKITANTKIGTDINFNLPIINDQAFTSTINGLINISTTEVAIFLVDQIYVVTQVSDELLGYRYDYLNTRLSVGIRSGDNVINTRDGVYTLYPTKQGLAIMNYQPNVATTDQIVEYVTDNITNIWSNFYNIGAMKILQMGDYIYLTNNTKNYLMLDLRNMSWWQFDSPINVTKLITDQTILRIINKGLYKYDKDYVVYKDLYNKFINWNLQSQPLHFNMPSHYKNMKQLIFQFKQSIDIHQSILTQVKLYRKQITLREPEIINFVVDSYRTFVKRFNYWKINELQWAIAADADTTAPARLQLNGVTIKYEQGGEVR